MTLDGQVIAARARKRFPRSVGFQGAYEDGAKARVSGLSADACPYARGRRRRGVRGWSPVWRTAWLEGWRYADKRLGSVRPPALES